MSLLIAIAILALGTYALRLAGVALHDRVEIPDALRTVLPLAAVALLAALATTAAFTDAGELVGVSRPAGVLAGALVALRRLPFVVVVVVAAGTAALLRAIGLP